MLDSRSRPNCDSRNGRQACQGIARVAKANASVPYGIVLSLPSMRLAVMLGKFECLFHKHDEKKTLFGGDRCGGVRGMDCALSVARRGARHIVGYVGTRQLTGFLWWGNTNHPRHLWPRSALYEDGSTCSEALEGARKAVEASVLL